jgi:tRNA 2-thiouridine synthesizing protein E
MKKGETMSIEFEGNTIETDANGYMTQPEQWSEGLAKVLAEQEGIELTQKHLDVANYLRDRYLNHGGEQPNMRKLIKGMQDVWGDKGVDSKALYELFPMGPAKQACKIAGLPETKTKGGY